MFDVLILVAIWASISESGIGKVLGPTWLMTPLCCINKAWTAVGYARCGQQRKGRCASRKYHSHQQQV